MKKEGVTDKRESCLFRNKQEEFGVDLSMVSGCTIVLNAFDMVLITESITIALLSIWKSWFSGKLSCYDLNLNCLTQVHVKS